MQLKTKSFWLVTVDMGYGHQRAVFPLNQWAYQKTLIANNYPDIPAADAELWESSRRFYEFISRFKHIPIIGEGAFKLYDHLQEIEDFYPRRDLSQGNIQVTAIDFLIRHQGWGQDLINKLNKKPKLSLVTSFFVPALMADVLGFEGEIYCLLCDTDIHRAWVGLKPNKSRINYLAPTLAIKNRLLEYGVRGEKIFSTGFPLPLTNIGEQNQIILSDLRDRLANLDPKRRYLSRYQAMIERTVTGIDFMNATKRKLILTFSVGGAGAQREMAADIIESLKLKIKDNQIKLILAAGIKTDVKAYFESLVSDADLRLGGQVEIIYAQDKSAYFKKFNDYLRVTDILWTKPSELVFYAGLGLPIIIAPPIGAHEYANQDWLIKTGAGLEAGDPKACGEWLFDWLDQGWLAEAALEGYLEVGHSGVENILRTVEQG